MVKDEYQHHYQNIASMFIKEKDITSYQLLLIKQDRVLVN